MSVIDKMAEMNLNDPYSEKTNKWGDQVQATTRNWASKFVGAIRYAAFCLTGGLLAILVYINQQLKPGPPFQEAGVMDNDGDMNRIIQMSEEEWEELEEISKRVVRRFADQHLVEITVEEIWEWLNIPDAAAMEWLLLASLSDRELLDMVKLWTLTH